MAKLLKIGSRGQDVVRLQTALGIKADGIFGKNTKEALIKFQKENNLKPDGVAGSKTFALLYGDRLLAVGLAGQDVARLQTALGIKADGIFGKNTKKALIKFQKENNLKPDGVAGPKTFAILYGMKSNDKPSDSDKPVEIVNINKLVETAKNVIKVYIDNDVKYSQAKREFGINAKFSDCSATVTTILEMANCRSFLRSTHTSAMRSEVAAKGGKFRKSNPKIGDIMMWGGHVTIVTDIDGEILRFAHMGNSGPKIGKVTLVKNTLKSESVWGSGGFIGFWTLS